MQMMTTHAPNGSIKAHNLKEHQRWLRAGEILSGIDVLHIAHDLQKFVLVEELLIKKLQLSVNSQLEVEVKVCSFINEQIIFSLLSDDVILVCHLLTCKPSNN